MDVLTGWFNLSTYSMKVDKSLNKQCMPSIKAKLHEVLKRKHVWEIFQIFQQTFVLQTILKLLTQNRTTFAMLSLQVAHFAGHVDPCLALLTAEKSKRPQLQEYEKAKRHFSRYICCDSALRGADELLLRQLMLHFGLVEHYQVA